MMSSSNNAKTGTPAPNLKSITRTMLSLRTSKSTVPKAPESRKSDALFEVESNVGRIKKRIDIGVRRSQRVLNIIARDRVAADDLTDEAIEGARIIDQKRHRRVERGAPLGIRRYFAQMRGHLLNETDGCRAAQDARCDAASERRVRRLERAPIPSTGTPWRALPLPFAVCCASRRSIRIALPGLCL